MSKPNILQMGDYPEWDQTPLEVAYTMYRYDLATNKAAFLTEVGASIEGIATRGDKGASAQIIAACPNLKVIAIYGVGFDAVDLDACRARGIHVTNTPDVLTKDVADLGLAMMLSLGRAVGAAEIWVRDGSWVARGCSPLTRRVHKSKVGILGLGRIGYEVARRCVGFEMDIAYSDIDAKAYAGDWTFIADPVKLAAHSDYLFVTLAASAQTHHIVGKDVIEAVGPTGMIINISRAANIDEEAILDALESGALGSAALDVFEGEPHLNPRFLELDNVLLQPHHASGTTETRKDMGALMRANLTAFFAGDDLLTPVV